MPLQGSSLWLTDQLRGDVALHELVQHSHLQQGLVRRTEARLLRPVDAAGGGVEVGEAVEVGFKYHALWNIFHPKNIRLFDSECGPA